VCPVTHWEVPMQRGIQRNTSLLVMPPHPPASRRRRLCARHPGPASRRKVAFRPSRLSKMGQL
jgi:hypothetical protein